MSEGATQAQSISGEQAHYLNNLYLHTAHVTVQTGKESLVN